MPRGAVFLSLAALMGGCALQVDEDVGESSAAQEVVRENVTDYLEWWAHDACRNKLPEECAQWCEEHPNNPSCGGSYNGDPEEPPPPEPGEDSYYVCYQTSPGTTVCVHPLAPLE